MPARKSNPPEEVRNSYEASTVGYQIGGGLDIGRFSAGRSLRR